MAVGDNSSTMDIINEEEKNADNPHLSPKKRTKDPGVRVKGGRIYDSDNGKTCHQCRQKTLDFSAFCKRVNNDKPCTLTFCHKCLLNRYGEKAEEVGKLEDWMCPRCRGVCNCSFCMKRKGYQPTGILSPTAKATGFNSVEELLDQKGGKVLELRNVVNDSTASPEKPPLSNKGLAALKRKRDKENQSVQQNVPESNEDGLAKKGKKGPKRSKNCDGSEETQVSVAGAEARSPKLSEANVSAKCGDHETNQDKEHADNMKAKALLNVRKPKKLAVKSHIESKKEDFVMPLGNPSTEIGGLELPSQDIGAEQSEANASAKLVAGAEARSPKLSEANVSAKCGDHETNQDKEHADNMKAKALLNVRKPKKLAVKSHNESKKEDFVMPLGNPSTEIGGLELPSQDIEAEQSEANASAKLVAGAEARSPKLSEANVSAKCGDHVTNQDKEHADNMKAKALLKVRKPKKFAVKSHIEYKKEDFVMPLGKPLTEIGGLELPSQDIGAEQSEANVSAKLVADAEARSPKLCEANVSAKCGDHETNQDKEHAYNMKAKALLKVRKPKKLAVKSHIEYKKEDFVMPLGKPLTEIGGLELPSQDIGAALQFLEFCGAFSEVLDITKGQPECILRDLTKGHAKRHKRLSALVRFNIKLLSLIDTEMKKDGDAWLQTLKSCIEESHCTLEELPIEFLDKGLSGYYDLEPSEKLKMLTFLCDEVLVTDELRNWIDEAEVKFDEGRKENKEKVVAARKKEKLIKQKAKDEMAKAMLSVRGGTPLSLAEFDDLLSQIRSEADKAQAEVRASLEFVPKKHQRSDAVRTDPLMLGSNGQILWKLSCHNPSLKIILQDIGNWDSVALQDKWFIYNEEEEAVAEKYVSSLRKPTFTKHRFGDAEEEMKSDSSKVPGSKDSFPHKEMGV